LTDLIKAQSPQGFWSAACKPQLDLFAKSGDCHVFTGFAALQSELQALAGTGKLTAEVEQVIATLIALFLLAEVFEDDKTQWSLVAQKAKNYLRQVGLDKPDSFLKKVDFKTI
jgi:hypothetical protein